jgi:hypothetical protein
MARSMGGLPRVVVLGMPFACAAIGGIAQRRFYKGVETGLLALVAVVCLLAILDGVVRWAGVERRAPWGNVPAVIAASLSGVAAVFIYPLPRACVLVSALWGAVAFLLDVGKPPSRFATNGRIALLATLMGVLGLNVAANPSLAWLGIVGALAALPALLAEAAEAGSREWDLAERYRRTVVALGLSWAVTAMVLYAIAVRPSIGGVDFFSVVCAARDMVDGASDGPPQRYCYFPGTYTFWRIAMSLGARSLGGLQVAYLGVLAANVGLVGAIVGRMTRRLGLAIFGAAWATVLLSWAEGGEGCTEPIATIPALLGVLAWCGAPLRGRTGFLQALALGGGFGAALVTKQQAGLLSLGAIALLPQLVAGPVERRHRLGPLAAIVVTAVVVFLIGIKLTGGGLAMIGEGLRTASEYQAQGTLLGNLLFRAQSSSDLALAFGLTGVVLLSWIAIMLRSETRHLLSEPPIALASFAACTAGLTLIQLQKRGYAHYLLLAVPFLVIAVSVAACALASRLSEAVRGRPSLRFVPIVLAAALLSDDGRTERSIGFSAWPVRWSSEPVELPRWYRRPAIARDLLRLGALVRPGEELVLVPPSRNEIHFFLGTRSLVSPHGYGWGQIPGVTLGGIARSGAVDAVVVVTQGEGDWEGLWREFECDKTIAGLEASGFHCAARLETMVLWRRQR